MIRDAKDVKRGKVFHSARVLSQKGSLDDYIDFLSENMDSIPLIPTKRLEAVSKPPIRWLEPFVKR
jgi:hypothetical protein